MDLAIIYELRANDVKEEDIELIMSRVKNRLSEENIDKELVKLGYPKIFTVDYSEYDNYDYSDSYSQQNRGNFNDLD
ncbi:hypothetical protein [Aliarcobacter cibarius]|jgi:NACalpha-BTF3-like transcription factor|uniref:Uncharacterized protein n=1 Tax=Aliarcobacter cibarius TaxID=255507 RepID=A0A5J6RI88_9BACT|nr:hypothetical protein [Aliarcobacter cibarius]QEZ88468.1 hypothetical protein ACIB15232_0273 [Aliarcobacter cibarius]QKJ26479.1 hypothetical protein ACBT_0515 [Aliarcobacter cibarius]TLT01966.1 hypothetical protein FE247_00920 [Aliarcobacter cibarius]TLT02301.1 hypothetical protein FE245_00920 [Aliarcobacter cibarius]TLT04732.1 hypothetical protein FE248_03615 [Aliarcobacter cibarius]